MKNLPAGVCTISPSKGRIISGVFEVYKATGNFGEDVALAAKSLLDETRKAYKSQTLDGTIKLYGFTFRLLDDGRMIYIQATAVEV
ncbi:MAG: hypothetical protein GC129_07075 [Proteobacteria bacterium]|nr:hypothetical protein [Pseudomonadota bacterium]